MPAYSFRRIFRRACGIFFATVLLCGGFFCLMPAAAGAFTAQAALEHTTVVAGEMTTFSITVTDGKPSNPPEIEQVAGLQIRASARRNSSGLSMGKPPPRLHTTTRFWPWNRGVYPGPVQTGHKEEEATTNAVKLTVSSYRAVFPRGRR